MKTGWILGLLLLAAATVVQGDDPGHASPKIDDPRWEFLKSLEGTWIGDSEIMPGQKGVFEFRVTAGGTAIEEREMIGTPMEMLTVYHMRGDELVGTHYCVMGNQPRVIAERRVVNDSLSFECDGKPGNTKSHDDHHVHAWKMQLDDQGRLHYSAELIEDGKSAEAPTSILTRQADRAAR